jgi:holo-[acyl-carrier protein] synthase
MIIGVGTDVVELARFEQSLERTPTLRDRLFTTAESKMPLESLAARFAAKEALAKALGAPGGLSWQDAEVVSDEDGRPSFALRGTVAERAAALGAARTHLSLSHDGGVAVAFVVLES